MRCSAIVTGLLSVAAVAEARSWQHVGKKQHKPERSNNGGNFLDNFLATRQVPQPRFANDNTTSKFSLPSISAVVSWLTGVIEFAVNGTGVPDVDFDVGESYSGYLPISDNPDDKNELFFWFFANSAGSDAKEILLWLNGGVSCSLY
jgi:carboxypeptidase D